MVASRFFTLPLVAVSFLASAICDTTAGDEILEKGPNSILSACYPMIDICARVTEEDITEFGVTKGESNLIKRELYDKITARVKVETADVGGSSSNTARAYGYLGGRACYFGIIGDDDAGRMFEEGCMDCGVKPMLIRKKDSYTSQIYCLVTPDAERTMYLLFGASHTMKRDDLDGSVMDDYDFYAVNGFLFADEEQVEFTNRMVEETLKRGKKLITLFANPFCVRCNGKWLKPIAEKSAYISGNLGEFSTLYEIDDHEKLFSTFEERTRGDNPKHTAVIITMGADGAMIIYQGKRYHVPAPTVEVVDTTGAGDFFAGGALYGLLNGWSVRKAGAFGTAMAGDIISRMGLAISEDLRTKIDEIMNSD